MKGEIMRKIAINGLGRIGRMVLRHYFLSAPSDVEIIAANDLISTDDLAYLLRYDSVQGNLKCLVRPGPGLLTIENHKIEVYSEKDPANLPWRKQRIDIVLECTGLFRKRRDAARHLQAGASRVIISSPTDDADLTVVLGVNEKKYDPQRHQVISNASCTTNSLAPAVKVLQDTFGVDDIMATTVHAYTSSQALVDRAARHRRRGRSAAVSLVPTSTGAARATELVLPELKGRIDAIAIRAPIPDGAVTDIVAYAKKDISVEAVKDAYRKATGGELKGILDYTDDEIVSADIIGNPHSGIVDGASTRIILNRVVKVLVWYDNEFGYARRLLDLAAYLAKHSL